ncbi:esterase/lipase family protein [Desulfocicer vacuolatum]|uniref:esterase/lipase family protein n=1 Tax=Desulfocicer vacuolatum TaxID=2298 RepID=UPI001BB0D21F|nr:alpha/beta hydrolase [Desulfocicer vacuolatum]
MKYYLNSKQLLVIFIVFTISGFTGIATAEVGKVVLLHGLARSNASMNGLQEALQNKGFDTCNIDYPSRKYPIEVLAKDHVLPQIQKCFGNLNSQICFVTHSMGGIIVRYLSGKKLIPHMGRVVMLSPPNQGSEIVDRLGGTKLFQLINGPAGAQLGTDNNSMPLRLGAADFEVGIITGNRSINLILSLLIQGKDDGKVSIERAKLQGMKDFMVLPSAHPFIMKSSMAIKQTIYFLNHGNFKKIKE